MDLLSLWRRKGRCCHTLWKQSTGEDQIRPTVWGDHNTLCVYPRSASYPVGIPLQTPKCRACSLNVRALNTEQPVVGARRRQRTFRGQQDHEVFKGACSAVKLNENVQIHVEIKVRFLSLFCLWDREDSCNWALSFVPSLYSAASTVFSLQPLCTGKSNQRDHSPSPQLVIST